jgi:hypothetical protein
VRQDGVSIGGSFGGVKRMVLTCAIDRPDYLQILVHESCHMDQYLNDPVIWKIGDSYDELHAWLDRSCIIRDIDQHINNVQDIELDCEKRAILKIKKYKLPIKQSEYIQRANAYLYFFSYLKHSRTWPSVDKAPYSQEIIWKQMPKTFQKSYRKLSKKYFNLFETHL